MPGVHRKRARMRELAGIVSALKLEHSFALRAYEDISALIPDERLAAYHRTTAGTLRLSQASALIDDMLTDLFAWLESLRIGAQAADSRDSGAKKSKGCGDQCPRRLSRGSGDSNIWVLGNQCRAGRTRAQHVQEAVSLNLRSAPCIDRAGHRMRMGPRFAAGKCRSAMIVEASASIPPSLSAGFLV